MPITLEDVQRRALSVVMDFIRAEDLLSSDDFPIKIAHIYVSLLEDQGELPDLEVFLRKAQRVRTTFFRLNTRLSKRAFLEDLLGELSSEIAPLLKEIKTPGQSGESTVGKSFCRRIYVEDIDSFSRVKEVNPKMVKESVPLSISEREIKRILADIIGEKFVPKDWAGEKSDLYSSFVEFQGSRLSTAFMLKGPSVRKLTIDRCGRRGNQLLRLVREPARLFMVQHIGEIDTDVIELLDALVSNLSQQRTEGLYYCVVDGVDTARILRAYGRL